MPVSKNSGNLRASRLLVTFAALLILGVAAAWRLRESAYFFGDAEAHLNIARRIFDSRTPGPSQIGTVWLPLPHVLLAPFARVDWLWISGLAGAIPSVLCFALAGSFLFAAAQRSFGSGVAAALLFAASPDMLYLQSTAMTEPVMAAALAAILWTSLRYLDSQSKWMLAGLGAASNAASLTRYEGWFLIPFLILFVWIAARKKTHAYVFALLASVAPVAWLAHNLYYYGDALAFYNGPYSARAIFERQVGLGMVQPAAGNWKLAALYYGQAARHVIGDPLLVVGAAGALAAFSRRAWWPVVLLLLPGAFYVWSIHSGGTPVFVPEFEPYTRYNTRYALALLPLAAFSAAALVGLVPERFRTWAAVALTIGVVAGHYREGVPIAWEEARRGSEARREWTARAAAYLKPNYRTGTGIVFWFGDLPPVLRAAGIPIREGLYQDNGALWDETRFAREEWALAQEGDAVDRAVRRQAFQVAERIEVKGAPAVLIYRRAQ